jgi:hypothetical protein
VAVDRGYGHILVADNGLSCVFVFDSDGKVLFQVYFFILIILNHGILKSVCSRHLPLVVMIP